MWRYFRIVPGRNPLVPWGALSDNGLREIRTVPENKPFPGFRSRRDRSLMFAREWNKLFALFDRREYFGKTSHHNRSSPCQLGRNDRCS
jgi:hypothetical protein